MNESMSGEENNLLRTSESTMPNRQSKRALDGIEKHGELACLADKDGKTQSTLRNEGEIGLLTAGRDCNAGAADRRCAPVGENPTVPTNSERSLSVEASMRKPLVTQKLDPLVKRRIDGRNLTVSTMSSKEEGSVPNDVALEQSANVSRPEFIPTVFGNVLKSGVEGHAPKPDKVRDGQYANGDAQVAEDPYTTKDHGPQLDTIGVPVKSKYQALPLQFISKNQEVRSMIRSLVIAKSVY